MMALTIFLYVVPFGYVVCRDDTPYTEFPTDIFLLTTLCWAAAFAIAAIQTVL